MKQHVTSGLLLVFVAIGCLQAKGQDILVDRQSRISFFSDGVLEDISAHTEQVSSALQLTTGEIAFKAPIKSFVFKKQLMQEHFNENYLESDQYPYATFTGKVDPSIITEKEGTYQTTVSGNLELHGVKKQYTIPATFTITKGGVSAHAKFSLKLADHGIKIPRVVIKNIAEVVDVDVSATYQRK